MSTFLALRPPLLALAATRAAAAVAVMAAPHGVAEIAAVISGLFQAFLATATTPFTSFDLAMVGCGSDYQVDLGADVDDNEVEAVEEFATAGAFEGLRWLASRLGPHSMFGSPGGGFSKRDALQLALQVATTPRH